MSVGHRSLGHRHYLRCEDPPTDADRDIVTELLGRAPRCAFDVVVRDSDGRPVVIRNEALLDDGTPMPTRYWLLGADESVLMGRLESLGGVNRAEADVDPIALDAAHRTYEADRAAALPNGHGGPTPYGGVGGTRTGVKCLHAHLGYWLTGAEDPIGDWIVEHLPEVDTAEWPPLPR